MGQGSAADTGSESPAVERHCDSSSPLPNGDSGDSEGHGARCAALPDEDSPAGQEQGQGR